MIDIDEMQDFHVNHSPSTTKEPFSHEKVVSRDEADTNARNWQLSSLPTVLRAATQDGGKKRWQPVKYTWSLSRGQWG